jgi:hypothetical protein
MGFRNGIALKKDVPVEPGLPPIYFSGNRELSRNLSLTSLSSSKQIIVSFLLKNILLN